MNVHRRVQAQGVARPALQNRAIVGDQGHAKDLRQRDELRMVGRQWMALGHGEQAP